MPSAIAWNRPSCTEPLHGVNANAKPVSLVGKHPEEEDAAIWTEWSPRGGRKVKRLRQSRRRKAAIERGVDHGGESGKSSPRVRSHSSSPSRDRFWMTAARGRNPIDLCRARGYPSSSSLTKGSHLFRWNTPGTLRSASTSYSTIYQRRSLAGTRRRSKGENISHSSDDAIPSRASNIGTDPEGASTGKSSSYSLAVTHRRPSPGLLPSSGYIRLGNLGGRFDLPESPYRTYRSKHARLVRARSSDRLGAERRRVAIREELGPHWHRRSRSAGDARPPRRRGKSGLTSPLLRDEGFGLLESDVTGKVGWSSRWSYCRKRLSV